MELQSMRMPQAQLIPQCVGSIIEFPVIPAYLLLVVVHKVGAAWVEQTGKEMSDFYKMVSNPIRFWWTSFIYLGTYILLHGQMSANPVGYVGAPQDVASLVGFIASKEAHFITGQAVGIAIKQ